MLKVNVVPALVLKLIMIAKRVALTFTDNCRDANLIVRQGEIIHEALQSNTTNISTIRDLQHYFTFVHHDICAKCVNNTCYPKLCIYLSAKTCNLSPYYILK